MVFTMLMVLSLLLSSCNNPNKTDITTQQINNLYAFTKLYGYIKYFHPSDEALKIDWDKFAIYGCKKVLESSNEDELIDILKELFEPIVPTLFIHKKNEVLNKNDSVQQPIDKYNLKVVICKNVGNYYKLIGSNCKDTFSEFNNVKIFPKQGELFTSTIGDNIEISFPLALYKDSIGTLPHYDNKRFENYCMKIKSEVPGKILASEKTTRLADIVISWNIFNYFYPYQDDLNFNLDTILQVMLKEGFEDKDEYDFLNTLKIIVSRMDDGHGLVKYENEINNFYYPAFECKWIENKIVVTDLIDTSSRLKLGDVIDEIDDKPSSDALLIADQYISGATLYAKRNGYFWDAQNSLMRLMSGDKDSSIKLKISRNANDTLSIIMKRTVLNVHKFRSTPKTEMLKEGIYYIDLTRINDEDFNFMFDKLKNAKGIIFDIRGYPQKISYTFLQHFIKTNVYSTYWLIPIILYPDKQKNSFYVKGRLELIPELPYISSKLAFLSDENAVSYAETLLGIIEQYKLGSTVGEPTAGTNGGVTNFNLPGGYNVQFTGQKTLKYDGSRHHGVGWIPTILVPKTIKSVIEKRDIQLEKAIEVVSK